MSVGRIRWVKAYESALHALRHVCDAGIDIEYTILGDSDPQARLAVLSAVRGQTAAAAGPDHL